MGRLKEGWMVWFEGKAKGYPYQTHQLDHLKPDFVPLIELLKVIFQVLMFNSSGLR